MKKLISIILTVVLLLSTVITVNAASFTDVKSSEWFYTSVNYVADKGIMQGTSSTKFAPTTSLSRAMGVTLLYRVAGTPSVSGVNIPFNDVQSGQWYTDAVKWAYKNGIVNGKTTTSFATNDNITRAEFATIINRYSDSMNYKLPVNRSNFVTDIAEIPSWAFAAVTVMYQAEIINGKDGGIFDPNANITRAEAAAMIERFMKAPKNAESGTETNPPVDNDPVPTTGKLVVKEKKYDYNGANVMILNVENQSNKNLTLTMTAKYSDVNGKTLKTETRKIEGFPANYRNYVILQPGIKFDKFSFEVKASAFGGEALMKYITCGNNVEVIAQPSIFDPAFTGREPRAEIMITYDIISTYPQDIFYSANFVLFDKYGKIFWIDNKTQGTHLLGHYPDWDTGKKNRFCTYDDVLFKDFTMPEELKGKCTGIVEIINIEHNVSVP